MIMGGRECENVGWGWSWWVVSSGGLSRFFSESLLLAVLAPGLAAHLRGLQRPVGAQLLNEGQRLALLHLQAGVLGGWGGLGRGVSRAKATAGDRVFWQGLQGSRQASRGSETVHIAAQGRVPDILVMCRGSGGLLRAWKGRKADLGRANNTAMRLAVATRAAQVGGGSRSIGSRKGRRG